MCVYAESFQKVSIRLKVMTKEKEILNRKEVELHDSSGVYLVG